jgi:opacity protein-like surface antigen
MKSTLFSLFVLGTFLFANSLFAQNRASFELRGHSSFPTEDFGNTNLQNGLGFEAMFDYRFLPHLSAYVGWGWNQMTTDVPQNELDVEETGYLFGLQFNHPIGDGWLSYYVRAGGTYNHLEIEDTSGDILDDSGHGLGYRLGLGLDITVLGNLHIKPGVKYQALTRDVTIATITNSVDHNYFAAGVGFAFDF